MLYAREVIELMAAYPGRDFRMIEIVRYVTGSRRHTGQAARIGIYRAVKELEAIGSIDVSPPKTARGGFALYRWKSAT